MASSALRAAGSSPRERGTHCSTQPDTSPDRFIPARAGNARAFEASRSASRVHPRASGERASSSQTSTVSAGSSPRERGTPGILRRPCRVRRFIPARAGNARGSGGHALARPVHPRASGERARAPAALRGADGSSPRERGTRFAAGAVARQDRFIPARAGNASRQWHKSPIPPVHPRASGERYIELPIRGYSTGSSPRERGTRRQGGG